MPQKTIISKRAAAWAQRCPHCHTGPVFIYPMWSLKFTAMHENCPVCGQKYEIEPGFFWGSMYVSYFLTVFIGFIVGFAVYMLVPDPPVWQVIGWICIALLITTPFCYRFSRLVMLYSFASIRFDPKAGKK